MVKCSKTPRSSSAVAPWWPCPYPHRPRRQRLRSLLICILAECLWSCRKGSPQEACEEVFLGAVSYSPPSVLWEAVRRLFSSSPGVLRRCGLFTLSPQNKAAKHKTASSVPFSNRESQNSCHSHLFPFVLVSSFFGCRTRTWELALLAFFLVLSIILSNKLNPGVAHYIFVYWSRHSGLGFVLAGMCTWHSWKISGLQVPSIKLPCLSLYPSTMWEWEDKRDKKLEWGTPTFEVQMKEEEWGKSRGCMVMRKGESWMEWCLQPFHN